MNELSIPFLPSPGTGWTFDEIDRQLDGLAHHDIDHLLWSTDGYKPQVHFSIAHNGSSIFLRFTVLENHIRMVHNTTNDPVYKDTCVEFFIGIEDAPNYYNLEFNCAGTCAVGYGSNKHDRKDLPTDVIANIKSQTKLWRINGDFAYCWELTLVIPTDIFVYHTPVNLNGLKCRLNFYKCGDDLPQPHYLSWSNIESAQPNFHLPEFFGEALFLEEK
ncbi:hypothetical protein BEL04_16220 [Mucilaginibacter sp. PPCGB 2223]|uniref:carbohydrate-binding family 9-like protein n=1 Tax=Mucilaginibacter sp. PPCGB 2223 TaxID=1886027 RepID=UPI000826DE34|nr:carbohydrate-binding family 9-like protein [Mucilaginibacter sp. PPCGB 2223]OCX51568.1 hypothetical protein BEL04_16220 [Mucilaginibacter sp. PPCGB 2223]